jgi:hypothetical protein
MILKGGTLMLWGMMNLAGTMIMASIYCLHKNIMVLRENSKVDRIIITSLSTTHSKNRVI